MGENFLKQQIKNFEKRRDLAVSELERETLFSRSDIFKMLYSAKPNDGETLTEGEVLYALIDHEGQSIVIARGHRTVGTVVGGGADVLREAMRDLGSIVRVKIQATSEVSRRVRIEILNE